MSVSQIDIFNVRNIGDASLKLSSSNLILGNNGSGKTSILEALYLLSYGKSFRSNSIDSVIQYDCENLVVRGVLDGKSIGVQRHRTGKFSIRFDGKDIKKVSELSRLLPIHVVEPNSIEIVEGAPSERRRFLDFSMFHVEHQYLEVLKSFNSSLKQRNALLKQKDCTQQQLRYWNQVYVDHAWQLSRYRERLFEAIIRPGFERAQGYLLPELGIDFDYADGCKRAASKEELMNFIESSYQSDIKFKTTQVGPHRADILLKYKGKLAKDYLSRGQKKLLTYGVRLAPAMMLASENKNVGLILIDDMPSELDEVSAGKVCSLLKEIGAQSILTAVDATNTQTQIINKTLLPSMFHVEHGCVTSNV